MAPPLADGEVLAQSRPVRRRRPRHPALTGVVSSVWTTEVPDSAATMRILPDAAIDLVFAGGRLVVAGPDTGPFLERLPPGRPVLGLQLCAGAVPAVLGAPASAARDSRVDVVDLWGRAGRDLTEAMGDAVDLAGAAARLETWLARQAGALELDPLAAAMVAHAHGRRRSTAGELGLGERQLRRRCLSLFGYGPKTLARILRFQAALEALRSTPAVALAELAVVSGYADQAHLTREVTALSGVPPGALRSALTSSPI